MMRIEVILGFAFIIGVVLIAGYFFVLRRQKMLAARALRHHVKFQDLEMPSELHKRTSVASNDSFYSCFGDLVELEQSFTLTGAAVRRRFSDHKPLKLVAVPSTSTLSSKASKAPSKNPNKVSHYTWMIPVIESIVKRTARGSLKTPVSGQIASPLFIVAGSCPSSFAPMQAVLFCHLRGDNVTDHIDFWFIKPKALEKNALERETLDKHDRGPHKNMAERSAKLFGAFADKFKGCTEGDFSFGTDDDDRAFIREDDGPPMYVYLMWMESTSSIMARKKYILGKLCYTKVPENATRWHTRQYRIEDGRVYIAPSDEEESLPSLMPPDSFQDMYDMSASATS